MKKLFALMLVALMAFSLAACGGKTDAPAPDTAAPDTTQTPDAADGEFVYPEGVENLQGSKYGYFFTINGIYMGSNDLEEGNPLFVETVADSTTDEFTAALADGTVSPDDCVLLARYKMAGFSSLEEGGVFSAPIFEMMAKDPAYSNAEYNAEYNMGA